MRKLWLLYFTVSFFDLYLTILFLDPSTEGNIIASKVWSLFGLKGIIFYKLFIIFCIVYPLCGYIQKKNMKAARAIVIIGIISTFMVCVLFGAMII